MSDTPIDSSAGSIAIVGMAGRFPGARTAGELWRNCATAWKRTQWLTPRGAARRRRCRRRLERPGLRAARAWCSTTWRCSTPGSSASAARRRDHRSAAPPLPGVRLGGAGGRRPHARDLRRRRSACSAAAACSAYLPYNLLTNPAAGRVDGPVPAAAHRQRQGLPGDPRLLPARPEGAERQRPDRLLDLAGGGPPGRAEPAVGRVRHGAGRRRDASSCRTARATCYAGGRDPLARRALPRLRRRGRGHGVRQRRGRRGAAAAGGRARRRRPHPRRDQGLGRSTTTARGRSATSRRAWTARPSVIAEALARRRRRRRARSATSRRTAPARRSATRSRSPR